jgi:hypothetical protein
VETVPSMSFVEEAGASSPYTRRRRGSPVRAWTVHGAIIGALAGGLTMALLKVSDQKLVELILQPFPENERFKMLGTVMGAILGAMVGLAAAGMLVVLVGRSLESLFGALLIGIGGGVIGALRGGTYTGPGDQTEVGWAILLLGTIGGTLAGMMLGLLIGAIISAARGPAPRAP